MNDDSFQENLFRHFHSWEHTGLLENVKITLIVKREDYWRRTLKTYAPFGLNVEDSVWTCFTTFGHYFLVPHLVSHQHFRYFFVETVKSFMCLTFTKQKSVLLSLIFLPEIVVFFIATPVTVVTIAFNDQQHAILSVQGKSWWQW